MNLWADKFLSTPLSGLVDKYILLSTQIKLGGRVLALKAIYHDFQSDKNNIDYGTELDFQGQLNLGEACNLLVKYAGYNARAHATDTKKFWVGIQYSF